MASSLASDVRVRGDAIAVDGYVMRREAALAGGFPET